MKKQPTKEYQDSNPDHTALHSDKLEAHSAEVGLWPQKSTTEPKPKLLRCKNIVYMQHLTL